VQTKQDVVMSEDILYLVHDRRQRCNDATLRLRELCTHSPSFPTMQLSISSSTAKSHKHPILVQQAVLHPPLVHHDHGSLHVHGLGLYLLVHLD
jgi:hypothetical protein